MKVLSVVTEQTRLKYCVRCGEQVRENLQVFAMRSGRGLLRGRAWVVVEHACPTGEPTPAPTAEGA